MGLPGIRAGRVIGRAPGCDRRGVEAGPACAPREEEPGPAGSPDPALDRPPTDRRAPTIHLRARGEPLMTWLIGQISPSGPSFGATAVLQSLAWPATAVLIAAMFRNEVRQVLERLVRLKYHDFEAQFRRDLNRSEDLSAQAGPRRLLDLPPGSRRVLHELSGAPAAAPRPTAGASGGDPRGVIESAWADLVATADRATGSTGDDPARPLADRGLLPGPALLLLDRLRAMRERLDVEPDWTPAADDAVRFAALAATVVARLGGAGASPRIIEDVS